MGKRDIDRIIEAKYDAFTKQAIGQLRTLPGDVWSGYAEDLQRGHSIVFDEYERLIELVCKGLVESLPPAELELLWFGSEAHWDYDGGPGRRHEWEEGVTQEFCRRLGNVAANLELDEDDEEESSFSISDDESFFLSQVIEMLTESAGGDRQFSPLEAKALKRTIAALKNLPDFTPGIDVRVEIGHSLGTEKFSERRTCVIEINSEHLEVSSGGSQYDEAIGSDSYQLDSFAWFPDGESERSGDSDSWLGLLAYILDTDPDFNFTDNSDDSSNEEKRSESEVDRSAGAVPSGGPGSFGVDRYRMDRVLWQLWAEYQRDFDVAPITEVQDLRAFSILWVATFMPEFVSVLFRKTLAKEVGRQREKPDLWGLCGSRTLILEAALYALTGEGSWLDTIRFNLDHHKRSHREIVTEALALVAERITFDVEMMGRIAHNLKVAHGFCEWPVILFAISKGDSFSKRQQMQGWLNSCDARGDEHEVLEKLIRGHWVANPFLNRLLRTQQFLTLRLMAVLPAPDPPIQICLLTPDQGELDLFDGSTDISADVWRRISEHPLTASMIKLEGVNPG